MTQFYIWQLFVLFGAFLVGCSLFPDLGSGAVCGLPADVVYKTRLVN
jgi:hypothetical protein